MRRVPGLALALLCLPLAVAAEDPPARPSSLPDFRLPDQDGKERSLAEWKAHKALVVVFTGTQCPQCNRFLTELARVRNDYSEEGVGVLGVNSNRNEQEEIAPHHREHAVPFPVLRDADHALADALGIAITPTVLVADEEGRIRYRGRIDRTAMGATATGEDLRAALDDVLAGREVRVPETEPTGCTVRREEPKKDGAVTWSRDVAPIVFRSCAGCHRAGQIGPMPLTDFQHASAFAQEIRAAVKARRMPPWKPTGGVEMHGARKLTQVEVDTIVAWVDEGAPQGDEKEEPELPEWKSSWLLGEPDLVLDPGEDFEVRAGPDLYWHFVMPQKWTEDKWVSAVEVLPGNSRIVHHVLAYLDETGIARRLDADDARLGYGGEGAFPGFVPTGEMGGWTPGFYAQPLPDGVARKLPKNAALVLQVHYNNPSGAAQKDRTRIGLHFAKAPVKQRLYQARILNPWFKIPAGEPAWEVSASWPVSRDVTIVSVMPHCHLLGKRVSMTVESPKGRRTTLLEIADWDFKWQDTYHLEKPMRVRDGSTVRLSMTYDNSTDNPRNPFSPPREVRWGERTSDEMCLGYVNFVKDHEDLTKAKK